MTIYELAEQYCERNDGKANTKELAAFLEKVVSQIANGMDHAIRKGYISTFADVETVIIQSLSTEEEE